MSVRDILENDALADAYNRGLEAEKAGDLDTATAAYEEALALDPQDHGGVAVRLAALGRAPSPDRAPEAYVETLFDQQAEAFEYILVEQLGYDVPNLVARALSEVSPQGFSRGLDLGCGTGLVARALGDKVRQLIGIDLSERMIDLCEDEDLYDGLYVGDVVSFLIENDEPSFDLIVAADVLPYLGRLDALMNAIARNLNTAGWFAFSSESLLEGEEGFKVTAHQRFAHSLNYIAQSVEAAGLQMVRCDTINVRNQDGAPTPGHLVLVRKV